MVHQVGQKGRRLKEIARREGWTWRDPAWIPSLITVIAKAMQDYMIRGVWYGKIIPNRGIYVMEEDWDNLILLDACRYDTFREVTGKDVDCRISRGSNTGEFIEENFAGKKLHNTVAVTANPNINRLAKGSFYHVIPVWKYGWDGKYNAVLPQTMVRYGLKAQREYPDKRLIIWFMQPHQPFIKYPELDPYGFRHLCEVTEFGTSKVPPIKNLWIEADKGAIDIKKVWEGYRTNLEIVLPYVFELAGELRGKTVITADHGNAFKRLLFPIPFRIAGHPRGIHVTDLTKVPWLVSQNGARREIKAGRVGRETVKARIAKLKGVGKL